MKPTHESGRTGALKHYPIHWRVDVDDMQARIVVTGCLSGTINVWARDKSSALRTARKECSRSIPSTAAGTLRLTIH